MKEERMRKLVTISKSIPYKVYSIIHNEVKVIKNMNKREQGRIMDTFRETASCELSVSVLITAPKSSSASPIAENSLCTAAST